MSNNNPSSFIAVNSPAPHKQRRKEMLLKYPEIKSLFGYEPKTKYITLILLIMQLMVAFISTTMNVFWWIMLLYFIGATISQSMFTAIHEITHNLAFKSKRANRYFALLINLPLGIPVAMSFEKYHHPHHRFLGDLKKDVDIPFESEAKAFNSVKGKLFWLLIQPITYGIRPLIKWPQKATSWEIANIVCQLAFDILIVCLFDGNV